MEIRIAKQCDLLDLVNLRFENALYHSDILKIGKLKIDTKEFLNEHTIKAFENTDSEIFLIFEDGRIEGYIIAFVNQQHPIFDFEVQGLIDDIYIRPDSQRKGFGQILVNNVFEWFDKHKVKRIDLNVYSSNQIGAGFWSKLGFEIMLNRITKHI